MLSTISQAARAAEQAKTLLQTALASASAVESITLLSLIEAAAVLEQKTEALCVAVAEDRRDRTPRLSGGQLDLALPWPTSTFRVAS